MKKLKLTLGKKVLVHTCDASDSETSECVNLTYEWKHIKSGDMLTF